jgi:hypothetical protein
MTSVEILLNRFHVSLTNVETMNTDAQEVPGEYVGEETRILAVSSIHGLVISLNDAWTALCYGNEIVAREKLSVTYLGPPCLHLPEVEKASPTWNCMRKCANATIFRPHWIIWRMTHGL